MKEYLVNVSTDLMSLETCNEVEDPRLRKGILTASVSKRKRTPTETTVRAYMRTGIHTYVLQSLRPV